MFSRILLSFLLSTALYAQTVTADNSKATSNPAAPANPMVDQLDLANSLLKSRQFPDAAAAFKAIIEKDPKSVPAHLGLMRSYLRARDFDNAVEAGKKAVQAVPSSALVHATFGDVNFRIGDMAGAEAEYKAALQTDAGSARGLYGMGKLYNMLSLYKHAKDSFTRAHQSDPSDREITSAWLDSLPRVQRYEEYKKLNDKHLGDEMASTDSEDHDTDLPNTEKLLKAEAEKKPWVVVGGVRPIQLKMVPYGRELAAISISKGNEGGAMSRAKGFALQVKFNDKASATLLLDTGAPGITIGNKLAEKVGAVKIADTFFRGVGEGITKSYYAWIDKIKIGDLEFKDGIVEVSSRNDIGEEAGLIGTDVFSDFLVTLDFREQKALLAPLPRNPAATGEDGEALDRYVAPEMQSFAKVYMFGDHLVAPTVLGTATKNATGLFVLDTGASSSTISNELAKKITNVSYEEGYVKGVSGKVSKIFSGDKVYFHFAGVHVESTDIISFDHRSLGGGTEIAGLIGITTLVQMKMTIDYRDGLVKLEPYEIRTIGR
ncbi:MAG: hypothetical protein DMG65_07640 [Candidatus Angelobacter sp. Gp1-AA117]|nr:MAG: hypothetical protein DMG65_07640 [Candidatus Angelobacter sp. Gp1-AA117]